MNDERVYITAEGRPGSGKNIKRSELTVERLASVFKVSNNDASCVWLRDGCLYIVCIIHYIIAQSRRTIFGNARRKHRDTV